MKLLDSHCHPHSFSQKDGGLQAVLERSGRAGVSRIIAVGTSTADWTLYRQLSHNHPGICYHTAGIHPCYVEEDWQEQLAVLPACFADNPAPVALGEIGLDNFHLPKNPQEAEVVRHRQREAFRRQLDLALQLDCPVIVHSRNAFHECVEMIDASGIDWQRVVFHCFAEGPAEVRQLRERGGRASFTGIVTYRNAEKVREAVREQGLDVLMIETDAPWLTPEAHRGKSCEPAFLRETAVCCAQILGVSEKTLAEATTRNTESFFGIPPETTP